MTLTARKSRQAPVGAATYPHPLPAPHATMAGHNSSLTAGVRRVETDRPPRTGLLEGSRARSWLDRQSGETREGIS